MCTVYHLPFNSQFDV